MLPHFPISASNNRAAAASRPLLVASPARIAFAATSASQVYRLRRHLTLHHIGWPSRVEKPATVRCKPSRPMMLLLLSSDVVPRHTNRCRATPAAVIRCKQLTHNRTTTPGCHHDYDCHHMSSAAPLELATRRDSCHQLLPPMTSGSMMPS